MAVLEILTYPHPLLKQVCQSVEAANQQLDDETAAFISDLLETLLAQPGCVGIAAPQTGVLKRIIIVDASRNRKPVENHGQMILINPAVELQEGEITAREGCLSFPHLTANVRRAKNIRIRALTADSKSQKLEEKVIETSDFEARVILHESDHLDGILFLDRVSSLKTDVFRRKRYTTD